MATALVIEAILMPPHDLPARLRHERYGREGQKFESWRKWSKLTMVAAEASYMIRECPETLEGPLHALGTDFSAIRFWPPRQTSLVQTCGNATGEHQERLYDQCCGHILPQATQWAPIGHC